MIWLFRKLLIPAAAFVAGMWLQADLDDARCDEAGGAMSAAGFCVGADP